MTPEKLLTSRTDYPVQVPSGSLEGFMGLTADIWFPVFTLVLGILLKGWFDAASDKRTLQREREARREQRQDALRFRRIEFQRETLLELQDAVGKLIRTTGAMNHADVMAYRETGEWRKQKLGEKLNEDFTNAQGLTARLRVRIHDEEVRNSAQELSNTCIRILMAESETIAEAGFDNLYGIIDKLSERVGAVLRSLDQDEQRAI